MYWLGNWQFACLDYYRPPKGVKDRCVRAEPFPPVLQRQVEKIEAAEWTDLGMPETLWVNRVREFGPLIISIDTKGKNLIEENKVVFNQKKKPILERINAQVRFIK